MLLSTSDALRVTQFRWRTFPVAQCVTTNLFVDKVVRCTLELQMETEVGLADSGGIAEVFQLCPPKRISERIIEQIVNCNRVSKRTSQVGCCACQLHGGEPVVMYLGVSNLEVPLVMSPVWQATGS